MKVSIVIPSYNEEKYLGQCLKSVSQQIEQPDEVIVVDNNSTDKTEEIAKQFGARVVKEEKQGMIFSRNRGFNEAKNELIARCDADTILPKDWIKKIKFHFTQQPIDALTGPVTFYDLPFETPVFSKALGRLAKLFLKGKNILSGPNIVITKQIWGKVANQVCLNDKLVHEDIDLAIHIHKIGGEIVWDDSLIVKISGRRIKKNPLSFFIEYPTRVIQTLYAHR